MAVALTLGFVALALGIVALTIGLEGRGQLGLGSCGFGLDTCSLVNMTGKQRW